jgi:hypothetical protein
MSKIGAEAELNRHFEAAGLSSGQRFLMTRILRAVHPNAYLSRHVSSANTVALAVSKAQAVLRSRSRGGPRQDVAPSRSPHSHSPY